MIAGGTSPEAAMTILEHPDALALLADATSPPDAARACADSLTAGAPRGCALVDARLYMPQVWADDPTRRTKTHVPADVTFQEGWRLALGLLDRARAGLPSRSVTGDDEFGRAGDLRGQLRLRRLRYV